MLSNIPLSAANAMPQGILIVTGIIIAAIVVLAIILTFVPLGLWISALAAGVRIGIFNLIGMRLRRVVPQDCQSPDQGDQGRIECKCG